MPPWNFKRWFRPLAQTTATALFSLAGLIATTTGEDAEPGAGSKALPGAHRTLADLLDEAERQATTDRRPKPPKAKPEKDWRWNPPPVPKPDEPPPPQKPQPRGGNRPVAVPAPAPIEPVALGDLRQLIDERNRVVDAAALFDTLKQIVRAEQAWFAQRRVVSQSAARFQQAHAAANLLNAPGANQVSSAAKDAARRDANRAKNELRRAQDALNARLRELQPLYARVAPSLGPWVRNYREMTKFLAPRRSDPNRAAVVATLEEAARQRDDFFEARVLAAFGHAYDGKIDRCGMHVESAIAFIDRYEPALYATHVTHDCAYVCILANKAHLVKGFIKMIEKLEPGRQSQGQMWLVACHAVNTKREATARQYFQRALTRAGAFKNVSADKPALPVDAILIGDAVHFLLTQKTVREDDVAKAGNLVDRADPAADCWQFARGKAALSAHQRDWANARKEMSMAVADCPATLSEEIAAEEQAYRTERLWSRFAGMPEISEVEIPADEVDAPAADSSLP
jgi:hypothetical protein